jgi:hypothetical protein
VVAGGRAVSVESLGSLSLSLYLSPSLPPADRMTRAYCLITTSIMIERKGGERREKEEKKIEKFEEERQEDSN